MRNSAWLTCEHAGQFAFASHGFARSAAVLDFFPMLLFDNCHGSAFNVKFIWDEFKHFIGAGFDAFAAAIAFVSFNYYEVVA
jgi:hypothetical protein